MLWRLHWLGYRLTSIVVRYHCILLVMTVLLKWLLCCDWLYWYDIVDILVVMTIISEQYCYCYDYEYYWCDGIDWYDTSDDGDIVEVLMMMILLELWWCRIIDHWKYCGNIDIDDLMLLLPVNGDCITVERLILIGNDITDDGIDEVLYCGDTDELMILLDHYCDDYCGGICCWWYWCYCVVMTVVLMDVTDTICVKVDVIVDVLYYIVDYYVVITLFIDDDSLVDVNYIYIVIDMILILLLRLSGIVVLQLMILLWWMLKVLMRRIVFWWYDMIWYVIVMMIVHWWCSWWLMYDYDTGDDYDILLVFIGEYCWWCWIGSTIIDVDWLFLWWWLVVIVILLCDVDDDGIVLLMMIVRWSDDDMMTIDTLVTKYYGDWHWLLLETMLLLLVWCDGIGSTIGYCWYRWWVITRYWLWLLLLPIGDLR